MKDYVMAHMNHSPQYPTGGYNKLWHYFKSLRWVEDFGVDRLTILQRQAFDIFSHWQLYIEIPFEARRLPSAAPPKERSLKLLSGSYSANQQTSLF